MYNGNVRQRFEFLPFKFARAIAVAAILLLHGGAPSQKEPPPD